MIKFNSFEEISLAYPINPEYNQGFTVRHAYEHVFTYQDIDLIKQLHPNGWLDREGHRYYYYDILAYTWYTHYIYDGENWFLGIDSWDGIQVAEEPTWGVQRECNFQRTEFGVFKTKAEAINYKNRKMEERLEF